MAAVCGQAGMCHVTNPRCEESPPTCARVAALFDEEIEQMMADCQPSAMVDWLESLRARVLAEINRLEVMPGRDSS